MSKNEFKLGSRLRDRVTELEGICVGRIEYLNGCVQYAIKPKVTADGKIADSEWVDSQQIEQVDEGIDVKPAVTGGYSKDAPRL